MGMSLRNLLLLLLILIPRAYGLDPLLSAQLRALWDDETPVNRTDMEQLRHEAWAMFDHGYSGYLHYAFPKDNLMPMSCKGKDWQGGIAVTLIDALDALLLMNRQGDMSHALELIKKHVTFDKDEKVHVFEVVIRVLGGLLSAHALLARNPDILGHQVYKGELLNKAQELAWRLAPAFDTPSRLPALFVNLQRGLLPQETNVTCTACAGTLLLEFGMLSEMTGDYRWRDLAEHAARVMYRQRSRLGLVGSSVEVGSGAWVNREATIGPGTDSYFEYLLKRFAGRRLDMQAYIMFGDPSHLEMFTELYAAAMHHLQLPGTISGYSFLADVHMDSGRLARGFVSSLGAFWPAMQALVGQDRDAQELHSNFTAAWRTFGWLPELFSFDLTKVHPEDPGYNLRPEHLESTFLLHATTKDPVYLKLARRFLKTLEVANRAACGYSQITNVHTGAHMDLMESFWLSETVKYLYLTFSEGAAHIIDYYILSTEGHLFPVYHPPKDQERREVEHLDSLLASGVDESMQSGRGPEGVPPNCQSICYARPIAEQMYIEAQLRAAFPLLSFLPADAALIRRRRCIACITVTQRMGNATLGTMAMRMRIQSLSQELSQMASGHTPAQSGEVLAQVLCVLQAAERQSGRPLICGTLRPLTPHDMQHGVPPSSLIMQLSWSPQPQQQPGILLVTPTHPSHQASLVFYGAAANFGPQLIEITPHCMAHLLGFAMNQTLTAANQTAGATLAEVEQQGAAAAAAGGDDTSHQQGRPHPDANELDSHARGSSVQPDQHHKQLNPVSSSDRYQWLLGSVSDVPHPAQLVSQLPSLPVMCAHNHYLAGLVAEMTQPVCAANQVAEKSEDENKNAASCSAGNEYKSEAHDSSKSGSHSRAPATPAAAQSEEFHLASPGLDDADSARDSQPVMQTLSQVAASTQQRAVKQGDASTFSEGQGQGPQGPPAVCTEQGTCSVSTDCDDSNHCGDSSQQEDQASQVTSEGGPAAIQQEPGEYDCSVLDCYGSAATSGSDNYLYPAEDPDHDSSIPVDTHSTEDSNTAVDAPSIHDSGTSIHAADVVPHGSNSEAPSDPPVHQDSAASAAIDSENDGGGGGDDQAAERERIAELVEYYQKHGCWGPLKSGVASTGTEGTTSADESMDQGFSHQQAAAEQGPDTGEPGIGDGSGLAGAQASQQGLKEYNSDQRSGSDQNGAPGDVIQDGSSDPPAGGDEDKERSTGIASDAQPARGQESQQQQKQVESGALGTDSSQVDTDSTKAHSGSRSGSDAEGTEVDAGTAGSLTAEEHTTQQESSEQQGQTSQQQTRTQQCSAISQAGSVAETLATAAAWPDPYATGTCKHVPLTAGSLVMAEPPHACTTLTNSQRLMGKVVVVLRGKGCSFVTKAAAVQAAGGAAMLVLNTMGHSDLITMSGDGSQVLGGLHIPALLITHDDSLLLLQAMAQAARSGAPPPVASMALAPAGEAGAAKVATASSGSRKAGRASADTAGAGTGSANGSSSQAGQGGSPTQEGQAHRDGKAAVAAGGAPADSSAGAGDKMPHQLNTRVDMLIPVTSHAFLQANVMSKGLDMHQTFEGLLADDRAMLLLLQVAQENLAMRQAALRMAQAQAQANLQKHQKSQQP